MARRGGYGRDVPGIEWAKLGAGADAEGKLSAASMGQDYYTWLNDAVAFHVYYCERYQLHQQYRHDQDEATRLNTYSVDPNDPRYQPGGKDRRSACRDRGREAHRGDSTGRGDNQWWC